jgi:uncharacterized protein
VIIREMTVQECRSMIAATTIARLGCARENQPYIVPIYVDLDDDFLYGYTSLGQHCEWMRQNPLVCVEFDQLIAHQQWKSVIVFGRYEELPHTPEHEESRAIAARLFQQRPMWWEPAAVPVAGHEQPIQIVFRIRIRTMTGRRGDSAS